MAPAHRYEPPRRRSTTVTFKSAAAVSPPYSHASFSAATPQDAPFAWKRPHPRLRRRYFGPSGWICRLCHAQLSEDPRRPLLFSSADCVTLSILSRRLQPVAASLNLSPQCAFDNIAQCPTLRLWSGMRLNDWRGSAVGGMPSVAAQSGERACASGTNGLRTQANTQMTLSSLCMRAPSPLFRLSTTQVKRRHAVIVVPPSLSLRYPRRAAG